MFAVLTVFWVLYRRLLDAYDYLIALCESVFEVVVLVVRTRTIADVCAGFLITLRYNCLQRQDLRDREMVESLLTDDSFPTQKEDLEGLQYAVDVANRQGWYQRHFLVQRLVMAYVRFRIDLDRVTLDEILMKGGDLPAYIQAKSQPQPV